MNAAVRRKPRSPTRRYPVTSRDIYIVSGCDAGRDQTAQQPALEMVVNCPTLLSAAILVAVLNPTLSTDEQSTSRQGGKYHLAAGKTYNMQSHDHARMLQKFAGLADHVPAGVVREHAAAIRFNTEAARRSYARLATSAGGNADLAEQVEQLQQRLAKVSASLSKLEAASTGAIANSQTVIAHTNEISQQLRDNHNDLRRIDQAFYNSDSDSYYTTGEGHFVD